MGGIRLDDFLDDFRTEALDHVRILDAQLLILEREPANQQAIRAMFASAHTIKGGAAMLELDALLRLAHAMEDLLDEIRGGRRQVDGRVADVLFQAIDRLRELARSSAPGRTEPDLATDGIVASLQGQRGQATEPEQPAAPAPPQIAPMPIALVVDDSATVRRLVASQLARAGFVVEQVGDGQSALALATDRPYNLIIAGFALSGLAGPDLAAAIRALPRRWRPAIVLISSDDNPDRRQRARDSGADGVIRKGSFRGQELANLALTLLASQRAAGQDMRSDGP
jgi:chemotaxis protein histidine kinase CheA